MKMEHGPKGQKRSRKEADKGLKPREQRDIRKFIRTGKFEALVDGGGKPEGRLFVLKGFWISEVPGP